jgi:uncharacterized protein (DUF2267 family)
MDEHSFLRAVAERAGCDERRAEGLAFVVFQLLRARITAKEADDVASQLPTALRRMWYEGAPPTDAASFDRNEFVGHVRRYAALPDDAEAERAVRAVFATLQRALGSPDAMHGEAWDVFSQLPKSLKQLWLDADRRE